MDTPLSLAPAAPVPTPPVEAEIIEAPAPVRIAPRKLAQPVPAPIRAEKVPLGVFALTLVTAVLLVFGAQSADPEGARIMDFAAAHPQP